MRPSQIPPLAPFKVIATRLHTPQSLAWSPDGELAVAADDSVHVYLPHFRNAPRLGEEEESSGDEDGVSGSERGRTADGGEDGGERPWFLRKRIREKRQYSAAPLRILIPHLTDPRVNRGLLAAQGAEVEFDEEEDDFQGVGVGVVTGFGSALNQVVGVQWSPAGLGPNLRPIVTALLTKGMVLAWGEVLARDNGADGGKRDFRHWRLLWGVGGSMPLPEGSGFSVKGDRIKAFAWGAEVGGGRALLGYHTDVEELVVLAVQYVEDVGEGMNSEGPAWRIDEVARVKVPGPHISADVHDPDYVPSGSAFSIEWSPWHTKNGTRTAVISYIAPNYVGFRRVTLGEWERGKVPDVRVGEEDVLGICCYLSSDAFVVWEDAMWDIRGTRVCRGVIATPLVAKVFEVDILGQGPALPGHRTRDCGTAYPPASDVTYHNPITGIIIHPPPPNSTVATHPLPLYTLTRLTATSTTKIWLQHNHPSPPDPPTWATTISKLANSTVPVSESYYPLDSASGSSASEGEDEPEPAEEPEANEPRVATRRVRIWALAQSVEGGASVALYSKHSAVMPDRIFRSRVAFATARRGSSVGMAKDGLSAEGRAWEWMYGGGPEVPGFSTDAEPVLGGVFERVREGMGCALCKASLELVAGEFVCGAGHIFARCATSALPVLAPSTSRQCALCGKPNLLPAELLRLADEHSLSEADKERARGVRGDVCSACGGKFVV